MQDPAIQAAVSTASAMVLQVTGAHTMTNRFYSVHPRRNDRFLKASSMLRTIYPQVDFTEFHFVRHLLSHLKSISDDRFDIVRSELATAWVARVRRFISQAEIPVHLLWLANHGPSDDISPDMDADPLFVTDTMMKQVSGVAASVHMIALSESNKGQETRGKFFGPREEAAARLLPGPELHTEAAISLLKSVETKKPHH